MALELQMHFRPDGTCYPVNCESNRRIAMARFVGEGDTVMTPGLCGFLFEFHALEPGSQLAVDAEVVAVKLQVSTGLRLPACRALAMGLRAENLPAFRELSVLGCPCCGGAMTCTIAAVDK
jgi:hypothetical protein